MCGATCRVWLCGWRRRGQALQHRFDHLVGRRSHVRRLYQPHDHRFFETLPVAGVVPPLHVGRGLGSRCQHRVEHALRRHGRLGALRGRRVSGAGPAAHPIRCLLHRSLGRRGLAHRDHRAAPCPARRLHEVCLPWGDVQALVAGVVHGRRGCLHHALLGHGVAVRLLSYPLRSCIGAHERLHRLGGVVGGPVSAAGLSAQPTLSLPLCTRHHRSGERHALRGHLLRDLRC
mmetsp:Transcript_117107/g.336000  ORF Transcript_117107/g.336000 Transcript_117107/m.336000 type:complete len:231 (+) Transcript_117107:70-762(+)